MNIQESLNYIHQTPKFSRELGNRLLGKLLGVFDNPQNAIPCIHIAGTNGKGSTAIMLAEILKEAGYRTGLFTSPYIERFHERIRIDGEPIHDEALARIITILRDAIEANDAPVSEFALDLAAAFLWFRENNCDIIVLETGLGGRLDATNIIPKSAVSVITSIGMDHMQYLGSTIEEITREKCGIIKQGCPVVTAPKQQPIVEEIIGQTAKEKGCSFYVADLPNQETKEFQYKGKIYTLGLQGHFQRMNAATVLETVECLKEKGYSIEEDAIKNGLLQSRNMARFERFGRRIILDGGHNLPAAEALCASLQNLEKSIVFCVAMMEDKDCIGFLDVLATCATKIYTTEIPMPRCCPAERLYHHIQKKGILAEIKKDPIEAITEAYAYAEETDQLLCICGSLYFAGMVRPILPKLEENVKKIRNIQK